MSKNCAKCGSDKIIEDVKAIDRGDYSSESDFTLAVDEFPDAIMFKQRIRSGVKTEVCGTCGYIEFYANEPQILYAAYQNKLKNKN